MKHPLINQIVIVRAYNAGVHIGTLEAAEEWVVLKDAYRIWQWDGAFTLSEVSHDGITGGKISRRVDTMTIPVGDVGEVLNVLPDAFESILKFVEGSKK